MNIVCFIKYHNNNISAKNFPRRKIWNLFKLEKLKVLKTKIDGVKESSN